VTLNTTQGEIPYPEDDDAPNFLAATQGFALAIDTQGIPTGIARDTIIPHPQPGQLMGYNTTYTGEHAQIYDGERECWIDVIPQTVILGSTQTVTNSTTVVNTNLVATLEATSRYVVLVDMFFSGPAAADVKTDWVDTFTIAPTDHNKQCFGPTGTTLGVTDVGAASGVRFSVHNASTVTTYATDGTRNSYCHEMHQIVTAGSDGFITMRFAQNTANVTGCNLLAGSSLRYWKVG
jgi:hypothetical protein